MPAIRNIRRTFHPRPMRAARLAALDPLNRWLAVVDVNPEVDLDMYTPLPDDEAMCRVLVNVTEVCFIPCA